MNGRIAISEMLDALEAELNETGLLLLDPFRKHFLSRPTRFHSNLYFIPTYRKLIAYYINEFIGLHQME